MPDADFPSGPWTGFYQYKDGSRGQQDLRLSFVGGCLSGSGTDEVGQFSVAGSYDTEAKEASWVKSYPGGHQVEYRGFSDGPVKGLWGTWRIPGDSGGGFHIWPLGEGASNERRKKAKKSLNLMPEEEAELVRVLKQMIKPE